SDGIAGIKKPPEQLAKFQTVLSCVCCALCTMIPLDLRFQRIPSNKPHGVKRSAIFTVAKTINGNDSWMFQPTRDLCFQQKARPTLGIVRVARLNFLYGNFAAEFLVEGHGHFAESSPCMGP